MQQVSQPDPERVEQQRIKTELAGRREGVEMQLLFKLLEYRLRKIKDRMVDLPLEQMARYQGEAVAYRELLRDLKGDR
jgi:hypothetical protein